MLPICNDLHEGAWRPLRGWERRNLAPCAAPRPRPGRPLAAPRSDRRHVAAPRGAARTSDSQIGFRRGPPLPRDLFTRCRPRAAGLFARVSGPRVAVFHDATVRRLPELSPAKSVARYPAYLQDLLRFDGIAAVSEDSRHRSSTTGGGSAFRIRHWRSPPRGASTPGALALRPHRRAARIARGFERPCTEGRSNHLALLEACEILWRRGLRFELRLIGLAHPQTGARPSCDSANSRPAGRGVTTARPPTPTSNRRP